MSSNPAHLEDLLSAVTDALIAQDGDPGQIARRYAMPQGQVAGYVALIRHLHIILNRVQPSQRFVNRLRDDLIGAPQPNVMARVRYLPPRVQIAAGLVAVMGFILLARRRLIGDAADNAEAPAQ